MLSKLKSAGEGGGGEKGNREKSFLVNTNSAKNDWLAVISAKANWLSVEWSPSILVAMNIQNDFSLGLTLVQKSVN